MTTKTLYRVFVLCTILLLLETSIPIRLIYLYFVRHHAQPIMLIVSTVLLVLELIAILVLGSKAKQLRNKARKIESDFSPSG